MRGRSLTNDSLLTHRRHDLIMEMIEEIRLHFKNAVKIEGVPIQQPPAQFHPAPFGVMKPLRKG